MALLFVLCVYGIVNGLIWALISADKKAYEKDCKKLKEKMGYKEVENIKFEDIKPSTLGKYGFVSSPWGSIPYHKINKKGIMIFSGILAAMLYVFLLSHILFA